MNPFAVGANSIGDVIVGGLIAEIGGIFRFESDDSLAKFSGIYWNEYQSADYSEDGAINIYAITSFRPPISSASIYLNMPNSIRANSKNPRPITTNALSF